ncbi:class I SAM-dependent methyltransferase [Luteimonas sp. A277]
MTGLALPRLDVMVLGLAALVAVAAGLIVGLRYRLATLSTQVGQLSATMDHRLTTQLGDFKRNSNEITGLVLRAFRDMEMASRDHAAGSREARQAIVLLSGTMTDTMDALTRGVDEASARTAETLEAVPSRVTEMLHASLFPDVERTERLIRQLIRDTNGLQPKVVEGLVAALAPRSEAFEKLMRQLIRDTNGLQPKVVEGLVATLAPRSETSEKLMRQLIRDAGAVPSKVAEAVHAQSVERNEIYDRLMRQILRDIGKVPAEVVSGIEAIARNGEKMSELAHRALAKMQYETMQEAEALMQLYGLFDLQAPMPLLGGVAKGWAMEPVTMLSVVKEVLSRKPGLIVECGSGTSTVWIGHALKKIGGGSLISLEHLEEFTLLGETALHEHGLGEVAQIRKAPLRACQVGGESFDWYDTAALDDVHDVSILIVDGPPSSTGPLARYPALPLLQSRLLPGALILVDDVGREDEQKVIARWQQENSALVNPRMISGRTMAFDYLPDVSARTKDPECW